MACTALAPSVVAEDPFCGALHRCQDLEADDYWSPAAASAVIAGSSSNVSSDAQLLPLPQEFIDFLLKQNVDPRVYYAAQTLPRCIRVKPSACNCDIVEELEKELGVQIQPVSWLSGFYRFPSQTSISSSEAYRSGKIYGMDAASGAAVAALDIQNGDHVLDVCAAPGAKLCMIAELLGRAGGTVTGVDISRQRLAACRTMLQKYKLGSRAKLFLADGTTFSILPLRSSTESVIRAISPSKTHFASAYLLQEGKLIEWRPRRTWKERKLEQRILLQEKDGNVDRSEPELFYYGKDSGIVGMQLESILTNAEVNVASNNGYDKVLVDAECTHDGSLKHICKFEQWGWETFEKRFFNHERVSEITKLQLRLLANGFRLLKKGGTLVYSTCSFTYDQNEGVVKQFLALHADAELREIEAARSWPCNHAGLPYCLRFDPFVSNTNGQFIAKIVKV